MARHVFPHFQSSATRIAASRAWAAENRPDFIGQTGAAIMSQFERHNQEHQTSD
jgi:hypothetical protein